VNISAAHLIDNITKLGIQIEFNKSDDLIEAKNGLKEEYIKLLTIADSKGKLDMLMLLTHRLSEANKKNLPKQEILKEINLIYNV